MFVKNKIKNRFGFNFLPNIRSEIFWGYILFTRMFLLAVPVVILNMSIPYICAYFLFYAAAFKIATMNFNPTETSGFVQITALSLKGYFDGILPLTTILSFLYCYEVLVTLVPKEFLLGNAIGIVLVTTHVAYRYSEDVKYPKMLVGIVLSMILTWMMSLSMELFLLILAGLTILEDRYLSAIPFNKLLETLSFKTFWVKTPKQWLEEENSMDKFTIPYAFRAFSGLANLNGFTDIHREFCWNEWYYRGDTLQKLTTDPRARFDDAGELIVETDEDRNYLLMHIIPKVIRSLWLDLARHLLTKLDIEQCTAEHKKMLATVILSNAIQSNDENLVRQVLEMLDGKQRLALLKGASGDYQAYSSDFRSFYRYTNFRLTDITGNAFDGDLCELRGFQAYIDFLVSEKAITVENVGSFRMNKRYSLFGAMCLCGMEGAVNTLLEAGYEVDIFSPEIKLVIFAHNLPEPAVPIKRSLWAKVTRGVEIKDEQQMNAIMHLVDQEFSEEELKEVLPSKPSVASWLIQIQSPRNAFRIFYPEFMRLKELVCADQLADLSAKFCHSPVWQSFKKSMFTLFLIAKRKNPDKKVPNSPVVIHALWIDHVKASGLDGRWANVLPLEGICASEDKDWTDVQRDAWAERLGKVSYK